MKYAFAMVVIVMLIDLEDKVSKIFKYMQRDEKQDVNKKKENYIKSEEFINKKVIINLSDECEIYNNSEILYDDIEGEILDFDSEWIEFKFYNKTKKKYICQFIRLIDIESIDIVSKD